MELMFLTGFLGVMAYFSARQVRLNRRMARMDGSRQDARHVGPHVAEPPHLPGL